jgi:hypothetical protein
MTRIAIPFPTVSLSQAFAQHPAPWSMGRRWRLQISGGEGCDIHDARGEHVLMCDVPIAEAILAAVHAAFLITPAGPLAAPLSDATAEPWRGQEAIETGDRQQGTGEGEEGSC